VERKEETILKLARPRLETIAATKVIKSGNWSCLGPLKLEFSEKLAKFQDAKYGTCVNGRISSIEVALKATGIVTGDAQT